MFVFIDTLRTYIHIHRRSERASLFRHTYIHFLSCLSYSSCRCDGSLACFFNAWNA